MKHALDIQSSKPLQQQQKLRLKLTLPSWEWFVTGWRLAIELIAPIALVGLVYTIRPVLTVGSLEPSDLHSTNGVKTPITVSGSGIRSVTVQCMTNKVIYMDGRALVIRDSVVLNEYSVRSVSAGESFIADCPFAWGLWTRPTDGFFVAGGNPNPQKTSNGYARFGIPFIIKNGLSYPRDGAPAIVKIDPDFRQFQRIDISAIDGYFAVTYKWAFSWLHQKKTIHVVARRIGGQVKWRIAPASEPIIPDIVQGDTLTVGGGPMILTRVGPPQ